MTIEMVSSKRSIRTAPIFLKDYRGNTENVAGRPSSEYFTFQISYSILMTIPEVILVCYTDCCPGELRERSDEILHSTNRRCNLDTPPSCTLTPPPNFPPGYNTNLLLLMRPELLGNSIIIDDLRRLHKLNHSHGSIIRHLMKDIKNMSPKPRFRRIHRRRRFPLDLSAGTDTDPVGGRHGRTARLAEILACVGCADCAAAAGLIV